MLFSSILIDFLVRLRWEIGNPSMICIVVDNQTIGTLTHQQIFQLSSVYIINVDTEHFPSKVWPECRHTYALALLKQPDLIVPILDAEHSDVGVKIVILGDGIANVSTFFTFPCNVPVLYIRHQRRTHDQLQIVTWKPYGLFHPASAIELSAVELWNRSDPRSQSFWGYGTNFVPQAPQFYAQLVPPLHIHGRLSTVSESFAFGPYILLMKLLAQRMTGDGRRDPLISAPNRDYAKWYRRFFGVALRSVDFSQLRNTRDAIVYERNATAEPIDNRTAIRIEAGLYGAYPVRNDKILLIVPYARNALESKCSDCGRLLVLAVWLLAVLLVALLRWINERNCRRTAGHRVALQTRRRSYVCIALDTWARSLGNSCSTESATSSVFSNSGSERLISVSLSAYAILAGSLVSGIWMQYLMNELDTHQIENLEDFIRETALDLRSPMESVPDFYA